MRTLSIVGLALSAAVCATPVAAQAPGAEVFRGADQAAALLRNLFDQVLRRFAARGVPVAFSMGSVTFQTPPRGLGEALRQADALMYEAKREGKGRMLHRIYT